LKVHRKKTKRQKKLKSKKTAPLSRTHGCIFLFIIFVFLSFLYATYRTITVPQYLDPASGRQKFFIDFFFVCKCLLLGLTEFVEI
jgi:hypothetical protein